MSLVQAWTFSSLILLTACSGLNKDPEHLEPVKGPVSQVYQYPYDRVWRALQKSIAQYPVSVMNIDAGRIETDEIRGLNVWNPPHKPKTKQPGLRYKLRVQMTKGNVGKTDATEVSIEKITKIEKSFFSGSEDIQSDGLEEEAILYRVQRELTIEQALDKAYERGQ